MRWIIYTSQVQRIDRQLPWLCERATVLYFFRELFLSFLGLMEVAPPPSSASDKAETVAEPLIRQLQRDTGTLHCAVGADKVGLGQTPGSCCLELVPRASGHKK